MSGLTIFIMVLVAACFTGLAYSAISAFSTAAQSYNSTYSKETSRSLEDMFLFIPPRRIAEISWLSAIVVFLLMFIMTGGVSGSLLQVMVRMLICLIIGGGVLFLPRYVIMWLKVRRRNRFNIQLVEALSGMSNAMKSGFSIMQAMEHIVANGESPISEEFETMLHQTRVGVGFQEALRNMDRRVGSEDLTLVVLSIETARKTGGNLTEIFASISHTIRERMRIEKRIDTLTAQGRLQGIVLSLMPIVIGLVLHLLKPGLFGPFLKSTIGIICLFVVAIMLILGALTIRKIVKIDI
jgi:tight adherence protein B